MRQCNLLAAAFGVFSIMLSSAWFGHSTAAAAVYRWDTGEFLGADFRDANLGYADLAGVDLTAAMFSRATLANADLTDAVVLLATFDRTTCFGFTAPQLYSTASYKTGNLAGLNLSNNNLSSWNFSGQNLTGAHFKNSTLAGADFTDALVELADLSGTTSHGFTAEQLYATASYKAGVLVNRNRTESDPDDRSSRYLDDVLIFLDEYSDGSPYPGKNNSFNLSRNDLSGWDFAGIKLTGALFEDSNMTGANLSSAIANDCIFNGAMLLFANLRGADLGNANFNNAVLTGADMTNALIQRANLTGMTNRGFTAAQFYSTDSYKSGRLVGIKLGENDLSGWNFAGKDMIWASFSGSNLAGADFTDTIIEQADFSSTTSHGFTANQLYSTDSYKQDKLVGVKLSDNNLSGWNFAGKDLTDASFSGSNLNGTDFIDASIKGVDLSNTTSRGFTAEQFYSTSSYKSGELGGVIWTPNLYQQCSTIWLTPPNAYPMQPYQKGIRLDDNDMSGWNFEGIDISLASFKNSILTGANLQGVTAGSTRFDNANLSNANLGGSYLSNAKFENTVLSHADLSDCFLPSAFFINAILTGADFNGSDMSGVRFDGADLTNANLASTELGFARFTGATLAGAVFTDACIRRVDFNDVTDRGFTADQLYSTATYKSGYLSYVRLSNNNLSGWNFSQQHLWDTSFEGSSLTGANFTDAYLQSTNFNNTTSRGFTAEQLYSTASYRNRDLNGISLSSNNLSGWSFARQDLGKVNFASSTLSNADFTNAAVIQTDFTNTTDTGFTAEQLYSTASYRDNNLSEIKLCENDLTNWDFAGKNLCGAAFTSSRLNGTVFTNADVRCADFGNATNHGFTAEQLYSTASYTNRELYGIKLWDNDLRGWTFVGQNMSRASFLRSNLTGVDFRNADLSCANFQHANLTDAIIKGANLGSSHLVAEQLYSTADYKSRDLAGISFSFHNMRGWNFTDQNLAGASFTSTKLEDADFSRANLSNADFNRADLFGANFNGAILPNELPMLPVINSAIVTLQQNLTLVSEREYPNALVAIDQGGELRTDSSVTIVGQVLNNGIINTGGNVLRLHGFVSGDGHTIGNVIFTDHYWVGRKAIELSDSPFFTIQTDIVPSVNVQLTEPPLYPVETHTTAAVAHDSVTFEDTCTLTMKLGGLLLGDEYDHMTVAETAYLGGVLELLLIDDFVPSEGDTFDLFDWNNVVGEFDQIVTPDDYVFDYSNLYLDGTITLTTISNTAVPEPSVLAMMVALLMIIGPMVRRRLETM